MYLCLKINKPLNYKKRISMWILCIGFLDGIRCRDARGLGVDLHCSIDVLLSFGLISKTWL